jgi:hypothetical protein
MRRTPLIAALVACAAMPLAAQKKSVAPRQAGKPSAIKPPAAAVGSWNGKTMVGPKDSLVSTFTFTLNADGSGREIIPNRDPVASKLVAVGGDSIVTETARIRSVLHPNLTAVTRTVYHIKGNTMSGVTYASYSDGSKLELKTVATRKK